MLVSLRIRDFAIIDAAEMDFGTGFTVITGETGAGKSILVDALTLALGGRASTDVVRANKAAAQVEALFDISKHPVVRDRLEARDLVGDDANTLLVRRKVAKKGRGKVTINGNLATVATLVEVVRGLVEISGQHEQHTLLSVENHVEILDDYAGITDKVAKFSNLLGRQRELTNELDELDANESERLRRADFLKFQVEEISSVDLKPGEDVELESERNRLSHAERLGRGAQLVEALTYGEDGSAFDKLGKAIAELESLVKIDASLSPVLEPLSNARREIQDAVHEVQRYESGVELDPERLRVVEERLDAIKQLCRKHGGDVAFVVQQGEKLKQELSRFTNSDAHRASVASRASGS